MSYADNVTNESLQSEFLLEIFPQYEIDPKYQIDFNGTASYIEVDIEDIFEAKYVTSINSATSRNDFDSEDFFADRLFNMVEVADPASVLSSSHYYYDKVEKRFYFATRAEQARIFIKYRIRAATTPLRTFYDLSDANSEIVNWDARLNENLSISRNIADTYTGFFPSVTENIVIEPNSYIKNLLAKSDFFNAEINIWHMVGDFKDQTNYQKIFNGFCSDSSYEFEAINISVNNGTRLLETTLQHPVDVQTFEDINDVVGYDLSDEDLSLVKRRVYGVVSGLKAVNVDRFPFNQNFPTNADNRKWFLSLYNGDNTKLSTAQVVGNLSNPKRHIQSIGTATSGSPLDRYLEISYEYDPLLTDEELIDEFQNVSFSPGDYIILELDSIPAQQFYLQIAYVDYSTFLESNNNSWTVQLFFTENIFDKISLEAGVSVDLQQLADKTITRLPVSRLTMQDDEGVLRELEPNIHWNMYQDVTNKFYGIELVSNFESLVGITYGVKHKFTVRIDSGAIGNNFDIFGGGTYANTFAHPLAYNYGFWFNVTDGDHAQSNPIITPGYHVVQVDILEADTAPEITTKFLNVMNATFGFYASGDFTATRVGATAIEVEVGVVGERVSGSGASAPGIFPARWFYEDTVYGYQGLSGNELIVARVYGPRADNPNFGRDSLLRQDGASTGLHVANALNNNYPSVIYDILNNYLKLDASDIDIDSFNKVLEYAAGSFSRADFSDINDYGILAGKYFNVNFSIPLSIGDEMPTSRDVLIELLLTELWQIFVNRFGKYSIRFIGQIDPDEIVTLNDTEYSFVSQFDYSSNDIYGNVFVSHDYMETSLGQNASTGYSEAVKSSNVKSSNLLASKRSISLNSLNQFADTTEFNKTKFDLVSSGVGTYGNSRNIYTNNILSDIFRSNINTFQIEVSRYYYFIDLGWRVTIDSDQLPTEISTQDNTYLVVGVTAFRNSIILTLSDIINRIDLVDPSDESNRELI